MNALGQERQRDRTSRRFHFTMARLRALPMPPAGKRAVYWDDECSHLALRVGGKAKTFVVVQHIGQRVEWRTLSPRFPELTVDDARKVAVVLGGRVAIGGRLAKDRRPHIADVTLRDFLIKFLDDYAAPVVSPRVARNWEILVRRHLLLANELKKPGGWRTAGASRYGNVRLSDVTKEWIAHAQARIAPRPGTVRRRTANQCVALLRLAFNVAQKQWGWDLPHANPAKDVTLFRDAERDAQRVRFLTGDELKRLFKALANEPDEPRLIVLLALVSGQRRGNVLSARWDALDLETGAWTIRHAPRAGTTTKSRRDHTAVLSPTLLGLLRAYRDTLPEDAVWLFPADSESGHVTDFKKPWRRITAAAKLTDFRFHDLRHSCATLLLAAGTPLPLIGSQLGHRSTESTARYAHVQIDGQRAAVMAAADALPAKLLTRGKCRSGHAAERTKKPPRKSQNDEGR